VTHRILVIDDTPAIHADFRKILCTDRRAVSELEAAEAVLFEERSQLGGQSRFEIQSAHQGIEGLALVHHAMQEGRPFAMAFVDVRMPPGWDGIEVTPRLWLADPDLPIVICTAYSDYSWEQMFAKLGATDRMFILQKPFDRMEVLQLAHSLTQRRQACREERSKNDNSTASLQSQATLLKQLREKFHSEIAALKRLDDDSMPPI